MAFRIGDMAVWAGKRVLVVDAHGFGERRTVDLRWTVSGVPGSTADSGPRMEIIGSRRGVPEAHLEPLPLE